MQTQYERYTWQNYYGAEFEIVAKIYMNAVGDGAEPPTTDIDIISCEPAFAYQMEEQDCKKYIANAIANQGRSYVRAGH